MGYNFTTKDGVVIAKLLQFVATDEQVNTAITNEYKRRKKYF